MQNTLVPELDALERKVDKLVQIKSIKPTEPTKKKVVKKPSKVRVIKNEDIVLKEPSITLNEDISEISGILKSSKVMPVRQNLKQKIGPEQVNTDKLIIKSALRNSSVCVMKNAQNKTFAGQFTEN